MEVIEIYFYPTYSVLVFDDGHEEIIEVENIGYVQEEMN
jgi:hypothetical protein